MKSNQQIRKQTGFSLIEMLMVLAILSLVLGVTIRAISNVEQRSRVEEAKVDLNQESREFVDQLVRDLHQSGYPTSSMYTTAPATQRNFYAQGITAADQSSISFEGDVDGDGIVDLLNYQLVTDTAVAPAGQCPCKLQRSQLQKVDGGPQPAPVYNTEVDRVINSVGGGGAWVLAGSFAISPTVTVANDTYYASFKNDPIFRYYNLSGKELTPVAGGTFVDPGGAAATVADIRSVRITVNTISQVTDPITNAYPASTVNASARIANK